MATEWPNWHDQRRYNADKAHTHIIRHTTAMELLRAGVDITVIAAWLGHVDLRTTHQYVRST
jgi:site-specific recombinase XerD